MLRQFTSCDCVLLQNLMEHGVLHLLHLPKKLDGGRNSKSELTVFSQPLAAQPFAGLAVCSCLALCSSLPNIRFSRNLNLNSISPQYCAKQARSFRTTIAQSGKSIKLKRMWS